MTIAWRKLRDNIQSTCANYDQVMLMTSGGVDSIFLVDFVLRNLELNPIIVHFKHGIRPDDHNEVKLVKKLAKDNNLPFLLGFGEGLRDIKNQECVARGQRWAFVEEEISKLSGRTIVLTAHHWNDNVESFFINSTRGRSVSNLVMKPIVEFGIYTKFKPLLEIDKDTIIKQATRRKLRWIEDATNLSDDLSCERNFWRNVILKDIKKIRNIDRSMRRLISDLSEMEYS